MNNQESLTRQLNLIRDRRERILYAFKSHEKAADNAEKMEKWRKRCAIILTAISVTTFLTSLVGLLFNEQVASLLVSFIALLSTIASLGSDIFDFKEDSKVHSTAGIRLRAIYQKYEALIADLESGQIPLLDAIVLRDSIAQEEAELLLTLPRTSRRDYKNADKALSRDEKISTFQDSQNGDA
ncbi:SLATT domain-containing protein [Actinotignum sp. GS-2025f]|uniref:SLATT domain-containing protein n=1 Tax=unclassified Actinotignum TaxID=2632702 RepID=UPI002A807B37|nr:SLATT domain-containing protein [Actinotignum sp. SLA_B059]MDY5127572.1 SLATT domain-containing protein [Actinotignum sp. SLA_B059]